MILKGKNRSTRKETILSATLSTTNPTDLGSNLDFHRERPRKNGLDQGTVLGSETTFHT
jgi:hypothetical protein